MGDKVTQSLKENEKHNHLIFWCNIIGVVLISAGIACSVVALIDYYFLVASLAFTAFGGFIWGFGNGHEWNRIK